MVGQGTRPLAQAIATRLYPARYKHFVQHTTQQMMPHIGFAQIPNVKVARTLCAAQKDAGKSGCVPAPVNAASLKHKVLEGTAGDTWQSCYLLPMQRVHELALAGRKERCIREVA